MEQEIINAQCPQCSPDETVPHKILKEKPDLLIKCTLCDSIHTQQVEKINEINLRVIVSTGETSVKRTLTVDEKEVISVDDEFIVEDETMDEADFVIVTSIESDNRRVDHARADEVQTVWARSTGKIAAKISITTGWQTESILMEVPGDYNFTVGEIITRGSDRFRIKKIKQRKGGFIKKEGESLMAKYIQRIFADSMERLEYLEKPTKSPAFHKSRLTGSAIRARGAAAWTLKKKEKD